MVCKEFPDQTSSAKVFTSAWSIAAFSEVHGQGESEALTWMPSGNRSSSSWQSRGIPRNPKQGGTTAEAEELAEQLVRGKEARRPTP